MIFVLFCCSHFFRVVLLGGDGSYHEVVNVLMRKKQEEHGIDVDDPNSPLSPLNMPIAMIPTGKIACTFFNMNVPAK